MASHHSDNTKGSAGGGRMRALVVLFVAAVLTVAVLAAGTACSQEGGQGSRMIRSSEEFQRGMRTGRREAKSSWSEQSGAWGWLWMMDKDYRTGYGEGWRRGRAEMRFKKQEKRASRERASDGDR